MCDYLGTLTYPDELPCRIFVRHIVIQQSWLCKKFCQYYTSVSYTVGIDIFKPAIHLLIYHY